MQTPNLIKCQRLPDEGVWTHFIDLREGNTELLRQLTMEDGWMMGEREEKRFHEENSKHRKGDRWREMYKRDQKVISQQIHPGKANNKNE